MVTTTVIIRLLRWLPCEIAEGGRMPSATYYHICSVADLVELSDKLPTPSTPRLGIGQVPRMPKRASTMLTILMHVKPPDCGLRCPCRLGDLQYCPNRIGYSVPGAFLDRKHPLT